MDDSDGSEPIADDEILFRRVADRSGHFDTRSERPVAWEAFRPNASDVDGLSVWRAKYKSPPEAAAEGARPNRLYYLLQLRVGRLREAGVVVEPSVAQGGRGHASLINLSAHEYSTNKNAVRELAERIASTLVERVEGPFGPFPATQE